MRSSVVLWKVKEIEDSWDEIIAACNDGTYATKYKIGNYKPLDLGSEGIVNMQIAGKDVDELADGSGFAKLSWISEKLLKTSSRYNNQLITNDDGTYQEGTGSVGGWEKSYLRTLLKEKINPVVPENVRIGMVSVTKKQKAINTSGENIEQTTFDSIWIPSENEIIVSYRKVFSKAYIREKGDGVDSMRDLYWWLRDASNDKATLARSARNRGKKEMQNLAVYQSFGIVIGFCF